MSGRGRADGDIYFEITVTNPEYSEGKVAAMLEAGDLYFYVGDTELYDEDAGKLVGTIHWDAEWPPTFDPFILKAGRMTHEERWGRPGGNDAATS